MGIRGKGGGPLLPPGPHPRLDGGMGVGQGTHGQQAQQGHGSGAGGAIAGWVRVG